MINLEVNLTQGKSEMVGTVIKALVEEEGKLIGTPDPNPILNTCLYEV